MRFLLTEDSLEVKKTGASFQAIFFDEFSTEIVLL